MPEPVSVLHEYQKEELYFKGGDHWNDAGQKLAATKMVEFLFQHRLISEAPPDQ